MKNVSPLIFLNKNGSSGFFVGEPKESKAAEGGC